MKFVESTRDVRFLTVPQNFTQYELLTAEDTQEVMQIFIRERWSFPVHLYFESMDEEEDILGIQAVPTNKTYSSMSLKGIRRKKLLTYTVQLENEVALQHAFETFFYVAEQNFLFVVASEPCIRFEGDEVVVRSTTAQLLIADYDGQAAMFCTRKEKKSDKNRM